MTLREALKHHPFVAGLPVQELASIEAIARKVEFQENEIVLAPGTRARNFFLLLTGSVCVEVSRPCYTVAVQALGPGDAFGWSSLLNHQDTMFQVRAREHSTAICLDGMSLWALCVENPHFGVVMLRRVLQMVAGRVNGAEARIAEFCGVHASDGVPT
jgi:CRP/FNR family cyclic AMP-dependent transcriptional regulator